MVQPARCTGNVRWLTIRPKPRPLDWAVFDHVIADGPTTDGNLVVACQEYNGSKGAKSVEDWLADVVVRVRWASSGAR